MEQTTVADESAQTQFEKFRDLTRKLIQVPKEELDAKLAEEQARRGKKPVQAQQ